MGSIIRDLRRDVTCKLCGQPFTNAHSFNSCGHTFCLDCVVPTLEGPGIVKSECPTCRRPAWKKDLVFNRKLQSIKEKVLALQAVWKVDMGGALAADPFEEQQQQQQQQQGKGKGGKRRKQEEEEEEEEQVKEEQQQQQEEEEEEQEEEQGVPPLQQQQQQQRPTPPSQRSKRLRRVQAQPQSVPPEEAPAGAAAAAAAVEDQQPATAAAASREGDSGSGQTWRGKGPAVEQQRQQQGLGASGFAMPMAVSSGSSRGRRDAVSATTIPDSTGSPLVEAGQQQEGQEQEQQQQEEGGELGEDGEPPLQQLLMATQPPDLIPETVPDSLGPPSRARSRSAAGAAGSAPEAAAGPGLTSSDGAFHALLWQLVSTDAPGTGSSGGDVGAGAGVELDPQFAARIRALPPPAPEVVARLAGERAEVAALLEQAEQELAAARRVNLTAQQQQQQQQQEYAPCCGLRPQRQPLRDLQLQQAGGEEAAAAGVATTAAAKGAAVGGKPMPPSQQQQQEPGDDLQVVEASEDAVPKRRRVETGFVDPPPTAAAVALQGGSTQLRQGNEAAAAAAPPTQQQQQQQQQQQHLWAQPRDKWAGWKCKTRKEGGHQREQRILQQHLMEDAARRRQRREEEEESLVVGPSPPVRAAPLVDLTGGPVEEDEGQVEQPAPPAPAAAPVQQQEEGRQEQQQAPSQQQPHSQRQPLPSHQQQQNRAGKGSQQAAPVKGASARPSGNGGSGSRRPAAAGANTAAAARPRSRPRAASQERAPDPDALARSLLGQRLVLFLGNNGSRQRLCLVESYCSKSRKHRVRFGDGGAAHVDLDEVAWLRAEDAAPPPQQQQQQQQQQDKQPPPPQQQQQQQQQQERPPQQQPQQQQQQEQHQQEERQGRRCSERQRARQQQAVAVQDLLEMHNAPPRFAAPSEATQAAVLALEAIATAPVGAASSGGGRGLAAALFGSEVAGSGSGRGVGATAAALPPPSTRQEPPKQQQQQQVEQWQQHSAGARPGRGAGPLVVLIGGDTGAGGPAVQAHLQQQVERLGGVIASSLHPRHLGFAVVLDGISTVSPAVAEALLCRAAVVGPAWLADSTAAGRLLMGDGEAERYLLETVSDREALAGGPAKALAARRASDMPLFHGLRAHLLPPTPLHAVRTNRRAGDAAAATAAHERVRRLLQLGGAELVPAPATPLDAAEQEDVQIFACCGAGGRADDAAAALAAAKAVWGCGRRPLSAEWVVDSARAYAWQPQVMYHL